MMMMMRWRRRMRRGRRRMRTTTIMTWWMLSMSMGWHGLAILIYDWLKVIPPDEAKRTLIRKIQTAYCTKVRTQRKGLMFFGLQPLPQLPQVCASLIGFLNLVAKKKTQTQETMALYCLWGEVSIVENVSRLFCAPGTHLAQFHFLNERITWSRLMDFLMIFLSM